MSHRVVGLDIGTHSVKVVGMRSGLRTQEIGSYHEEPLGPLDASEAAQEEREGMGLPLDPRALRALDRLSERGVLEGDAVFVSFDLGDCVQANVKLPFKERNRVEAVLPIQIEDRFPLEMAKLTTDFQISSGTGETIEHQVNVVGTPTDKMRRFLDALAERGVDPRVVEVGPARLLAAGEFLKPGSSTGTVALVEIGHSSTDVCVVQNGEITLMRNLRIGGLVFTERIAQTFGLDLEQAEQVKHQQGFVEASTPTENPSSDRERMHAACFGPTNEIARDLARTFHGFSATNGQRVGAVYLCGGGANLNGIAELLASALGVEVRPLWHEQAEHIVPGGGYRAVGAVGLAARGLGHRPASGLNLRQGTLAYRGDYEFIRAKALTLGIAALLLVISIIFVVVAKRKAVEARVEAYSDALCASTQRVFGDCIRNPNLVLSRLNSATNDRSWYPDVSAYEIFRDVSSTLVYLREDEEIPVEIEKFVVDVQRDVIQVEGRTNSAASVDFIIEELDLLDCLSNTESRQTQQVRGTGMFHFELRAQNACNGGLE